MATRDHSTAEAASLGLLVLGRGIEGKQGRAPSHCGLLVQTAAIVPSSLTVLMAAAWEFFEPSLDEAGLRAIDQKSIALLRRGLYNASRWTRSRAARAMCL